MKFERNNKYLHLLVQRLSQTVALVAVKPGFFLFLRSMVYTYDKELGKATFMTLMIITLCLYIIGGVVWLIDDGGAIRGVFAIVAGALLMVDLILKSLGK